MTAGSEVVEDLFGAAERRRGSARRGSGGDTTGFRLVQSECGHSQCDGFAGCGAMNTAGCQIFAGDGYGKGRLVQWHDAGQARELEAVQRSRDGGRYRRVRASRAQALELRRRGFGLWCVGAFIGWGELETVIELGEWGGILQFRSAGLSRRR
jgi:hypothetical protein